METKMVNGQLLEIIQYDPRPHQRELDALIWNRVTTQKGPRFLVPVDHRRSGKTAGLFNSLVKVCTTIKKPRQAYFLYPQQKKIREHIWDNPEILGKYLPTSQVAKKDDQRLVLYFKTGWQLLFDGTDENPDKHRGGNGFIYALDEYDDQQKRMFTEIVRPIIEANGGLAILSGTPRGVKQLHDAYTAGQDPLRSEWWSRILDARHSLNADGTRLLGDDQLENIQRDYQAEGIGGAFDQEYLCAFVQGEAQVFRKLDQVTQDKFGKPLQEKEPEERKFYLLGCDPALTQDYWVNSVIDLHTFEEVCLERFQPRDTNLGEARTEALARKYNNALIKMGQAGIDKTIADHLRSKGLSLEEVPSVQKDQLVTNLSLMIDALTVRFLPDPVAMAEMRDFTFNRLPSGRYQFSAPEGKHDDTVMARAHAVWNIGMPLGTGDINLPESIFGENTKQSNTEYGKNRRRT